jgi:hypothetical protein
MKSGKAKPGIFTVREALYEETWQDMAFLPVRIFFQGKDGDPKYFDGKLSPFLLIFPFFAFLRFRRDPAHLKAEKTIFASFAFLYFFLALFTFGLRIRYIAPFIPALVILSIFGINRIQEILTQSSVISSEARNPSKFKGSLVSLFGRNDMPNGNFATRSCPIEQNKGLHISRYRIVSAHLQRILCIWPIQGSRPFQLSERIRIEEEESDTKQIHFVQAVKGLFWHFLLPFRIKRFYNPSTFNGIE